MSLLKDVLVLARALTLPLPTEAAIDSVRVRALKDLEMPSPQCVREQKDDFSRLPVQDLQRRAEALTQKLQRSRED